jgi:anaerobic magnesium-protoporphyrin IX monomethyl ester cyclase
MKILLIRPPTQNIYQGHMPLGLAYVAGSLLHYGHEIAIWDLDIERWSNQEVCDRIKREVREYHLIGITSIAGDYPYIKWITNQIRATHPDKKIIIGGYIASALPGFLMEALPVDYIAIGEGEKTIVELADVIKTGSNPSHVTGLYYRDLSGEIKSSPPRDRICSLDDLPFPPWDLFPMDAYLKGESADDNSSGSVSIMASRGCPFRCNYCDHTIKGYIPRYRSVENVMEEIRILLKKYGDKINKFYFWDDILIWDRKWIMDFCESLLKKDLRIKWSCNCHVSMIERELVAMMRRTGCTTVRFGIESGSQRILDSLNKGVKVEEALKSLNICLEEGMDLVIYIMTGMTGENIDTINDTIEFFRELAHPLYIEQLRNINFFMLTPLPGTELFEKLSQDGLIKNMGEYLERKCDAFYDIPLNISECPDDELRSLKKKLESEVLRVLKESRNQFKYILNDMTKELKK